MFKRLKVKVGRFYIHYFFWFALWLSIAILLYGLFIILSAKGESSNILANFGSFSGGMATVIAALVAVREFILFRHNQGVKEFREFLFGEFELKYKKDGTMSSINPYKNKYFETQLLHKS